MNAPTKTEMVSAPMTADMAVGLTTRAQELGMTRAGLIRHVMTQFLAGNVVVPTAFSPTKAA